MKENNNDITILDQDDTTIFTTVLGLEGFGIRGKRYMAGSPNEILIHPSEITPLIKYLDKSGYIKQYFNAKPPPLFTETQGEKL